jgi:hypothetical protein
VWDERPAAAAADDPERGNGNTTSAEGELLRKVGNRVFISQLVSHASVIDVTDFVSPRFLFDVDNSRGEHCVSLQVTRAATAGGSVTAECRLSRNTTGQLSLPDYKTGQK